MLLFKQNRLIFPPQQTGFYLIKAFVLIYLVIKATTETKRTKESRHKVLFQTILEVALHSSLSL